MGCGGTGPRAGRRQRRPSAGCTHPRARGTCAPSLPAVLSPPKPGCRPRRGALPPPPGRRAPAGGRRLLLPLDSQPGCRERDEVADAQLAVQLERSQAPLFFTNFTERVCARAQPLQKVPSRND
ncbi:unnamed protein product [Rangifer tarandus platyrhynchus]|uniref:Uncharacterized protein n=1 Tax=Rangifer tarandus platyrhynchus TaxID=3082113 RepID=A0ABN8ZLE1_RANTA|nr:unnamed protein product [Rangifer tarandus platyrhynchus]